MFLRRMLVVFFLEGFSGLKKRVTRFKSYMQSNDDRVPSSTHDLPQFSEKIIEMYGRQHLLDAERFFAEKKRKYFRSL